MGEHAVSGLTFRPIADPGPADSAYVVYRIGGGNFGGLTSIGTVLRYADHWSAATPAGTVVATGEPSRDAAAKALDR